MRRTFGLTAAPVPSKKVRDTMIADFKLWATKRVNDEADGYWEFAPKEKNGRVYMDAHVWHPPNPSLQSLPARASRVDQMIREFLRRHYHYDGYYPSKRVELSEQWKALKDSYYYHH